MGKHGVKQTMRIGWGLKSLCSVSKVSSCAEAKARQRRTVLQLGLGKNYLQFRFG